MSFKLLSFVFLLLIPLMGWSLDTTLSVTLKDGTEAVIRPVTGDPKDRKAMYVILKDPDTCQTMRDGTLWPDQSIDNTYAYYVENWQTFKDLQSLGINNPQLVFGFLIFSKDGNIMGLGGIQNSSWKGPHKELYFAFLPPYRNKGLGKKFGQFLMHFSKSLYGDRILEANILPDNTASKALIKKLGFVLHVDQNGKAVPYRYPRWGNRLYNIYRYTPPSSFEK